MNKRREMKHTIGTMKGEAIVVILFITVLTTLVTIVFGKKSEERILIAMGAMMKVVRKYKGQLQNLGHTGLAQRQHSDKQVNEEALHKAKVLKMGFEIKIHAHISLRCNEIKRLSVSQDQETAALKSSFLTSSTSSSLASR